jgi:hypothetical protein
MVGIKIDSIIKGGKMQFSLKKNSILNDVVPILNDVGVRLFGEENDH